MARAGAIELISLIRVALIRGLRRNVPDERQQVAHRSAHSPVKDG
jgi:hypothetical protein